MIALHPTIPKTPLHRIYHKDGHIAMPLSHVLEIYNLACEYSRDGWEFIERGTGKLVASDIRTGEIKSPWDSLRRDGLLEPEVFGPKAKIFRANHNNNQRSRSKKKS